MLKNAHIWSMGAARMRALGPVASVQHTPRMMRILFQVTLETSSDSHSSYPLMRGGFRAFFWMQGNGRNRSQCRNRLSPS